SSVMLYTRDTYLTQNTLFVTMSLICGITYPIQYLPGWMQKLAQIFPLTPAVTLFRNVVIGSQNLSANGSLILQVLVLSGVYLMVGTVWYKHMERNLVESVFG
ncbi:MAG: ABC transporter permease, partial [Dorea sp.]